MTVRTLFAWAIARGELAANPALGVDLPMTTPPPPGIHTPEQVRRVLETAAKLLVANRLKAG